VAACSSVSPFEGDETERNEETRDGRAEELDDEDEEDGTAVSPDCPFDEAAFSRLSLLGAASESIRSGSEPM
jgi:hypothetical protein